MPEKPVAPEDPHSPADETLPADPEMKGLARDAGGPSARASGQEEPDSTPAPDTND